MKITVNNLQKRYLFSKSLITKIVSSLLKREKIFCDEVVIYFVTERKIKELHKKYFDDPSATDCITFPIDRKREGGYFFLGEIFISPKAAISYAKMHDGDPKLELILYLVHGVLHLLGYKDENKKDKSIMRKKEKSCMDFIKRNFI